MSVTFFALKGNDIVTDLEDVELNVSNVNAIRIQRALGFPYDSADSPYGEITTTDFLSALSGAYRAYGHRADMRVYLTQLNSLWGAACDANATHITWA